MTHYQKNKQTPIDVEILKQEALNLLALGVKFRWINARPSNKTKWREFPLFDGLESWEDNKGYINVLSPENLIQEEITPFIEELWEKVRPSSKNSEGELEAIRYYYRASKNKPQFLEEAEDKKLQYAIHLYLCKRRHFIPSSITNNEIKKWSHKGFFINNKNRSKKCKEGINPFTNNRYLCIPKFGDSEKEEYTGCKNYIEIKNIEIRARVRARRSVEKMGSPFETNSNKKENKTIFPYQLPSYLELEETLLDFAKGDWRKIKIRPRWHRLIVGRTGTGKSHLAKKLAQNNNIPLLNIGTSSWILLAARGDTEYTWKQILRFVDENESGIIFLDEIDKIHHSDCAWVIQLRTEVFQLLDYSMPLGLYTPEGIEKSTLEKKLKENFFIIAAGAFQDTLESIQAKKVGFLPPTTLQQNAPDHNQLAKVLQRELVNRFGEVLYLPFPEKMDYEEMIQETINHLPENIKIPFKTIAAEELEGAITAQLGARMIETCIAKAIRIARKCEIKLIEEVKTKEDKQEKLKSFNDISISP